MSMDDTYRSLSGDRKSAKQNLKSPYSQPLWKSSAPDSQDYEEVENVVWRRHQVRRYFSERGEFWNSDRKRTALKWVLTTIIGVLVGLVGLAVSYATEELIVLKLDTVLALIDKEMWLAGYFTLMAWTSLFVCIAYGFVLWEPLSSGSGIPEVKCFLNGINLNKAVRMKTFLGKACGMIFSVATGLPTGKEGPMVHCGAIIAAGVSQGKSSTWGFDTSWSRFQDFRNDRAKRDFVSCGAAAGVCAAFRAPIGGVLFALEEGSSFWSTDLTWRAFFCAMMTLLTIYIIRTADSSLGQPDETSMFNFGEFYNLTNGTGNYSVWELFLFIAIGAMGGIMGAVFIHLNTRVLILRKIYASDKAFRFLEFLMASLLVSTLSFCMPLVWEKCNNKPVDVSDFTTQERTLVDDLVNYGCPGDKYNELASLMMSPPDVAVRQLFHFREDSSTDNPTFSSISLLLYFIIYWIMAVFTNGLACTTGLFVPTLTAGALIGRLIGHVLHELSHNTFADAGTYALIGAAAMMGGTARTTISLTVMLLEATGDMQYVLPLMLTLLAARYVGNFLSKGIYDVAIELNHLPYIEPSLGGHYGLLRYVPISEIMATPVRVLHANERVSDLQLTLLSCPHNAFPVVDGQGRIQGIVQRKTLCMMLQQKAFSMPQELTSNLTLNSIDSERLVSAQNEDLISEMASVNLSYDALERNYPRYPHIVDIKLNEQEKQFICDMRPYMDSAPYIIHEQTSVQRAFRLFRSMGLRHLVVVDCEHQVRGIVTRKELTEHRLEHLGVQGREMRKALYLSPLTIEMTRQNAASESESFLLPWSAGMVSDSANENKKERTSSAPTTSM